MKKLEKAANVAVNQCMKVKPEDRVLIVADNASKEIGMAIRSAALAITDKVRFFNIDLPSYGGRPIKSMPQSLKDAIKECTVSFFVAKACEGELETLRGPLLQLVVQKARHAHMVGLNMKIMETGICVDYDEVSRITKKVFDIVSKASEIKVTSPAGTDIVATLDSGMKWIPCSGVIEKMGEWDNLPGGEVFTAPKSMTGKLVVDGTLGDWVGSKYNEKVNYRETPLVITIENVGNGSYIKNIYCKQSDLLADFKKYVGEEKCASRVGELGLGTNIFLKELVNNILQDEKFPTVHVAFGFPYPEKTGADWSCDHHRDLLMRECTIVVDGKEIMSKGKYSKEILSK